MKHRFMYAVLAAGLLFGGCGSGSPAADDAAETENEAALILGKEAEGSKSVILCNKTGQEITSVKLIEGTAAQQDAAQKEAEELMPAQGEWKQDEKAELFYPAADKEEAEGKNSDADSSQIALKKLTSVILTLKNGEEKTLYDVNFQNVKDDAQLLLQDGVVYMTYTSTEDEPVNTLESQKAQLEKIAKEKEEAEAKAKADEEAAKQNATQEETAQVQQEYQEPVYEEPVYSYEEPDYQEPVYQEPVYQEPVYEEPSYQEPQTPAETPDVGDQTGQDCMSGGIVIRP